MEEEIGRITHFFPRIQVGVIQVTRGILRIGDVIRIKGHTTDFIQRVESLEMEHAQVREVGEGQSAGFKVECPVRENDAVFRVAEE